MRCPEVGRSRQTHDFRPGGNERMLYVGYARARTHLPAPRDGRGEHEYREDKQDNSTAAAPAARIKGII